MQYVFTVWTCIKHCMCPDLGVAVFAVNVDDSLFLVLAMFLCSPKVCEPKLTLFLTPFFSVHEDVEMATISRYRQDHLHSRLSDDDLLACRDVG